MIALRTPRRLALAALVAIAFTLLPVAPAAALPAAGGGMFHTFPTAWSFLWRIFAPAGWKIGSDIDPDGAPTESGTGTAPGGSPLEIGSHIDPDG